MTSRDIPVIDLFAGPGGLAEGFSSANSSGAPRFRVALSIEKDPNAFQTLKLRSFFRTFGGRPPNEYYDYLRGDIARAELEANPRFAENWQIASREALQLTLGAESRSTVSKLVYERLKGTDEWVLIGGPPCQAYSLIGRARMQSRTNTSQFEKDERHFLYKEYLRIIAEHAPSVFIMENVKGLLSSKINDKRMFDQILSDLQTPSRNGPRYRVVPLNQPASRLDPDPRDFILCSEQFGVPQARHRVILCGVREDIVGSPEPLRAQLPISVSSAIGDLPRIRSRLSRSDDSARDWQRALVEGAKIAQREADLDLSDVVLEMLSSADRAIGITSPGNRFIVGSASDARRGNSQYMRWIHDRRIEGYACHESRAHMRSDLYRYLFSSSFALVNGTSPRLGDFPTNLLPRHRSARSKSGNFAFPDRFRVQLSGEPATTITSHISKDGHYFIHPDPSQCRSFTVREAARLQSFPDNYLFEGNRTQQFHQVGNAVPPLLAFQIAKSVQEFLSRSTSYSKLRRGDTIRPAAAS
jgi:DNA (cytosine-5)-methyltransferase 1